MFNPHFLHEFRVRAVATCCWLVALASSGSVADGQTRSGPDVADAIGKRLQTFRDQAELDERPLRVVYFHPADVEPLTDYRQRLTRIMLDIQKFYRDEVARNGFGLKTFSLEIQDEALVLHVVKGKLNSDQYTFESGDRVRREIASALAGEFDLSSEFVLVVNAMCQRRDDGSYFFHAPYHGNGGARNGLCQVADCELMDTRHFTETERRIRYTEHNGTRDQTLANFTCLYIGGIAHELGHAFGYQHNLEKPWERQTRGKALMGAGNYTYRHELRGRPGSFLTFATSMQLASHPLFTDTRSCLDREPQTEIEELTFSQRGRSLVITGKVHADVEPYGVIAFTNPAIEMGWQNQDYDALTWTSEVLDGRFTVVAKTHTPGRSGLKLRLCHLNGMQSNFNFEYESDADGVPDAAALNDEWLVQGVEQVYLNGDRDEAAARAKQSLTAVAGDVAKAKMEHMMSLVSQEQLRGLNEIKDETVYLSQVQWRDAGVGWGKPARDQCYSDDMIRNSVFLELGDKFYARGLYAHAPSRYEFDLAGAWKTFEATAGLQKGAGETPSGVFIVKADGKVLHQSALLQGSAVERIKVDVSGVDRLELIVESGKRGNGRCWTIWGAAKVAR